eukprot:2967185-Rhodomonas_salina.1
MKPIKWEMQYYYPGITGTREVCRKSWMADSLSLVKTLANFQVRVAKCLVTNSEPPCTGTRKSNPQVLAKAAVPVHVHPPQYKLWTRSSFAAYGNFPCASQRTCHRFPVVQNCKTKTQIFTTQSPQHEARGLVQAFGQWYKRDSELVTRKYTVYPGTGTRHEVGEGFTR